MIQRKFIIFLVMLLLAAGVSVCRAGMALQLGDTREQIEARYDTAPVGDHQKGIAIYQWDLWKLQIQYTEDVAHSLVYTNLDPVTDDEINTILEENGGLAHWKATGSVEGRAVSWVRSDGASAVFDEKGRSVTLHGGKMPVPVATPAPLAAPSVAQVQGVKPVAIAPVVKIAPTVQPSAIPAIPALSAVPVAVQKPKESIAPKVAAVAPAATPTATSIALSFISPYLKFNWKYELLGLAVIAVVAVGLLLIFGRRKGPKKTPENYPFSGGVDSNPRTKALMMVPSLETMEWQQFELLMGEVFRRQGYQVEISSGDGADGGVDLRLKKEGALVLAQCKRYLSGKVSVGAIREFFGVIKSEQAARGIFLNTSVYTPDALNFARNNEELELLDRDGVLALIASVTRPDENIYDIQRWIAEFKASAVIVHPNCQFCESPMVLRRSKTGTSFWGCPSFPQCSGTRDARMELVGDTLIRAK